MEERRVQNVMQGECLFLPHKWLILGITEKEVQNHIQKIMEKDKVFPKNGLEYSYQNQFEWFSYSSSLVFRYNPIYPQREEKRIVDHIGYDNIACGFSIRIINIDSLLRARPYVIHGKKLFFCFWTGFMKFRWLFKLSQILILFELGIMKYWIGEE